MIVVVVVIVIVVIRCTDFVLLRPRVELSKDLAVWPHQPPKASRYDLNLSKIRVIIYIHQYIGSSDFSFNYATSIIYFFTKYRT